MHDNDAMREFMFTHSSPEKCKFVRRPNGWSAVLTQSELLVPAEWRRAQDVYRDAEELARKHGALPALILHGPATNAELRTVTTAIAFRGLRLYWIGEENIIRHRALVSEVLGARDRVTRINATPEAISFAI